MKDLTPAQQKLLLALDAFQFCSLSSVEAHPRTTAALVEKGLIESTGYTARLSLAGHKLLADNGHLDEAALTRAEAAIREWWSKWTPPEGEDVRSWSDFRWARLSAELDNHARLGRYLRGKLLKGDKYDSLVYARDLWRSRSSAGTHHAHTIYTKAHAADILAEQIRFDAPS